MTRQEVLASLDIPALSREIREVNEANGWREGDRYDWGDPHKIPSALALIHSEISEAWEAKQSDLGELFAEELADVAIRIIDMMEGLGLETPIDRLDALPGTPIEGLESGLDGRINDLHFAVSQALEEFRQNKKPAFSFWIAAAFVDIATICVVCRIDLNAEIKAKVAKNRQRGYRHGNKRV